MDTLLVDGLFHMLSHELVANQNRQVQVFLDRRRLQTGRNFKTDFSVAAMNSTVMVLIVSKAALVKMLSLQAESEDNVLLEWTLALQLIAIKQLHFCIPVMIGEVMEEQALITNLFQDGILEKLPDIVSTATTKQVEALLRSNGFEPSPDLHTLTVRGTVKKVLEGLGVATWDVASSHGGAGGAGAASSAGTASLHSQERWRRCIYRHIVKETMKCLEKAEAQGLSKVTGGPLPGDHGVGGEDAICEQEPDGRQSIDDWLKSISLDAYAFQIKEYGCDSLLVLDAQTEKDIQDMIEDAKIGMKRPHRTLFLRAWKDRATRGEGKESVSAAGASAASSAGDVAGDAGPVDCKSEVASERVSGGAGERGPRSQAAVVSADGGGGGNRERERAERARSARAGAHGQAARTSQEHKGGSRAEEDAGGDRGGADADERGE